MTLWRESHFVTFSKSMKLFLIFSERHFVFGFLKFFCELVFRFLHPLRYTILGLLHFPRDPLFGLLHLLLQVFLHRWRGGHVPVLPQVLHGQRRSSESHCVARRCGDLQESREHQTNVTLTCRTLRVLYCNLWFHEELLTSMEPFHFTQGS